MYTAWAQRQGLEVSWWADPYLDGSLPDSPVALMELRELLRQLQRDLEIPDTLPLPQYGKRDKLRIAGPSGTCTALAHPFLKLGGPL